MINIQVKGLDELISNMGEAGASVIPLTRSALNKSALAIKTRAKANVPVAFGKLKGGLSHTVEDDVRGIVWSKKNYGIFVELGTRPHWAPIEPLKRWAQLKLGNASLGYAVQKKIAMKGTKAQPFMQPAVIESMQDIRSNFGELAMQLVRIMSK
jgi:HK97 gp10 family phage protein